MASSEETSGRTAPDRSGAALLAKLRPPVPSPYQVQRERICESVCAADFVKLVLVRAPAGFGKTTAMLQCRARLEAGGVPTAWLTLDRADNDVGRFLASLEAAFDQMRRAAGRPRARTAAGRSAGERALALIDRMAGLGGKDGRFALFLDDFEAIQDPAVTDLLWQLVEALPHGARLVLGSRWVPQRGLGRLRARGELLEIEPAELRFTAAESAAFLVRARGLALPAAAVNSLHRRTEGWATALWLASVALERRPHPDAFIAGFSGTDAAIADYLLEDVFLHLPQAVRGFLLRTAVLDELSAPLCDALRAAAGEARDSAEILAWLERANLFLIPLDGAREAAGGPAAVAGGPARWYRYHSLFSDFLRAQPAAAGPDQLPAMHLAASQWFATQGRPVPAIEHALAAGDSGRALPLLRDNVDDLLAQGRMRLLARWLGSVPAGGLAAWPKLQIAQVWAVSFTRGPSDAIALLQAIDPGACEPEVQAHVRALRHMLLHMMDRFDEARAASRDDPLPLPMGYPFPDSILATSMARLAAVRGDYREARRLLALARQAVHGSDSNFNKIFSESVEGLIDLRQGRLQQALARFRVAASTMLPNRYGPTNGNAMACLLLAEALYESNHCERAERLLNVYVPLARDLGLPDQIISGHIVLARIAFERGEADQAYQWLAGLEHLGHHRSLPRLVQSALLERGRLALLQGNRHAAADALQRASDPDLWKTRAGVTSFANDVENVALAQLRLDLANGPAPAAREAITRELAAARRGELMRRALKLRVLQAVAWEREGDEARAREAMAETVRFCATEGFVRIVADEGAVARRLAAQAVQDAGDTLPAAYVQRLLQACAPERSAEQAAAPQAAPTRAALPEPLTPKEEKVLHLLAEGFSNVAMAERLFVSETTVRTHLRNISAKLRASNRTQAVAIARQLGLL
ncbi:LuxR family transcriptional regulator [Cupriavidus sp. USMAHM13]|uniref:LuxR C-terminal-related transcriptional regulator n=1 Tax=Cupriavidus sp. USMAHM13 TaxID=1389192 RepID=UPI0008A70FEF|nr:LuxR C-terminal-related transcriptional regulator [Cupriavidus sp. USMAHM13]AOZ01435.1 LuxR family transcriptional regulator [Cupriavidus sp. USMAHM13]